MAITLRDGVYRDDYGNSCSVAHFGSKAGAKQAIESLCDCYDCYDCYDCSESSPLKHVVPVIPSIHQAVLSAVSMPDAFDMRFWHMCDTTHCRAGWVVHLAGTPGKELEDRTSTAFAAHAIYKASSSLAVPFVRFYDTNEVAMADMVRLAEAEAMSNR